MIAVKIKPWTPIDGVIHIGTTWQVATDIYFTNIIEVSNEDVDNLLYLSQVTVPVGHTYYVRAQRNFDNPNHDYFTDPMPVSNIEEEYSTFTLSKDITIDTPMIYVNDDSLYDTADTFKVRTSKFRSNSNAHLYTHWLILDGVDEVLYSSLYDANDKIEKNIPKSIGYLNKNAIKIIAIHVGPNGIESPLGMITKELGKFNFEVVSNLVNVKPNVPLEIKLSRPKPLLDLKIVTVEVVNSGSDETIYETNTIDNNTITIPSYLMLPGQKFYLDIYAYSDLDVYSKVRKQITVTDYNVSNIINERHVYDKALTDHYIEYDIHIADYTTSTMLPDRTIAVVEQDRYIIRTYEVIDKKLVPTNIELGGASLIGGSNVGTYLKYLDNNYLFVDTLSPDGTPLFLLFLHNIHTNEFNLMSTISRPAETKSIGWTNAIYQVDINNFIYNPVGTNKLIKVNIANNTLTDLPDIPLNPTSTFTFAYLGNNRILIIGGTNNETMVYDFGSNIYTKGISIVPASFVNANLKTISLINGDSLILNPSITESTVFNSLYLDFNTKVMSPINLDMVVDYPTSATLSITGDVVLSKYKVGTIFNPTARNTIYRVFS